MVSLLLKLAIVKVDVTMKMVNGKRLLCVRCAN